MKYDMRGGCREAEGEEERSRSEGKQRSGKRRKRRSGGKQRGKQK